MTVATILRQPRNHSFFLTVFQKLATERDVRRKPENEIEWFYDDKLARKAALKGERENKRSTLGRRENVTVGHLVFSSAVRGVRTSRGKPLAVKPANQIRSVCEAERRKRRELTHRERKPHTRTSFLELGKLSCEPIAAALAWRNGKIEFASHEVIQVAVRLELLLGLLDSVLPIAFAGLSVLAARAFGTVLAQFDAVEAGDDAALMRVAVVRLHRREMVSARAYEIRQRGPNDRARAERLKRSFRRLARELLIIE